MRIRIAAACPRPARREEALWNVHEKRYFIEIDADKCANMRTALQKKA